ncbi:hypothetical protein F0562_001771 [Nyssa sinensis]|uniref:Uncharacterized protein n=1 Tax=Nyssa sinensis TaxID=561372 RepID=A0A5J5C827_9ASTE|nr:hypothetical protein F0562_001771 [Nyssa sinensis]
MSLLVSSGSFQNFNRLYLKDALAVWIDGEGDDGGEIDPNEIAVVYNTLATIENLIEVEPSVEMVCERTKLRRASFSVPSIATIFEAPRTTDARSGWNMVRGRRTLAAKIPYNCPSLPPPPPQSPNWLTALILPTTRMIASGAGKLLFSVFGPDTPSSSSSSSDDDSGSGYGCGYGVSLFLN